MIVKRYIAHPPLFSILAGIPPSIYGARDYLDCRLTTINLTPIFISTFTIILVFLVSYKIYKSNSVSIIASLIYATVPLIVAAGRIAKRRLPPCARPHHRRAMCFKIYGI